MKPAAGAWISTLLFVLTIAMACDRGGSGQAGSGSLAAVSDSQPIARGRYLVEGLLQCFMCHSERNWEAPGAPPVEGRAGAGRVLWQDDGYRLVAPNLTPDDQTGIGRLTDEQLARAIRQGIGRDGRVLSRRMWYNSFRHLTDDDVAAVIAYLRSRQPVYNPLPKTALPLETQARNDSRPPPILKPVDLASADPVEVGRGLVLLANCEGCHTAWEAPRQPGLLGGGNLIERGQTESAFSTNITSHPSGVAYDADAFIEVIRTGKSGSLHSIMPWIVFRNLSDSDLRAIHAFLQTMHPVAHYINNHAEQTLCPVCQQEHGLGELNRIERPSGIRLDPSTYDRYVGSFYSKDYDFTFTVSVDGDRLMVSDDGEPSVELIPVSPTRFLVIGWVAPLRFVLDSDGRALRVISEEIEQIVLERVDEL